MSTQFNIGCSGFYNRHWKGVFYPENLPQKQWLNYYCEHFSTLELNTTFYNFPTKEKLRAWKDKSPSDFIFSVKAPKLITHLKKFTDCKKLLNDFYLACEQGMGKKLGCLLFQLPPSIHYNEEKLDEIIKYLRPGFTNVIEFRHNSWWKNRVYERFSEKKIAFCSVSHPTMPGEIIANTKTAYVRMHGTPKMFYSNYPVKELEQLKNTLSKKKKPIVAFVYFNNTAGKSGVLNALRLKKIIDRVESKK